MAYNLPIGSIYHLYTTYILPSVGLYATYHLLGERKTTIDTCFNHVILGGHVFRVNEPSCEVVKKPPPRCQWYTRLVPKKNSTQLLHVEGKWPGVYLDVSKNRGGPPKSSHFNRVFHYKPSILGKPYLWQHLFDVMYIHGLNKYTAEITYPSSQIHGKMGVSPIGSLPFKYSHFTLP